MEVLEQVKQKIQEIQSKKNDLVKYLEADFFLLLKPIFEKSEGKLHSLKWTQYTPYFNDGDECTLRVNTDYLYVNGEEECPDELYDLVEQASTILQEIPDELMQDIFGDHVEVTVYSDGKIGIEEYDHD
ncbi:MAG TPA: hypothetical protein VL947_06125 [Cytophagales bacterium]|nr:hypothetical protein [Cytophagales bacterium]